MKKQEELLQQAARWRTGPQEAGWRGESLAALKEAATIRADDSVRMEALAALAGEDAATLLHLTDIGATHLRWRSDGHALLMDGGATSEPVRVWNAISGKVEVMKATGRGPVWFSPDSKPRLLRRASPERGIGGGWISAACRGPSVGCHSVMNSPVRCNPRSARMVVGWGAG